jgi:hypothetical protein
MRKVLSIFLLCFLISQTSCNSGNIIQGRVLDLWNKPVKNVEVGFVAYKSDKTGTSGGLKSKSITNEKGEFEITVGKTQKDENLGLVVRKEGYKQEIIKFTAEEIRKFDEVFRDYTIFLKKDE